MQVCQHVKPYEQFMYVYTTTIYNMGFPGGLVVKNSPANAGGTGLNSRLGRYPGEGIGNPL